MIYNVMIFDVAFINCSINSGTADDVGGMHYSDRGRAVRKIPQL